MPPPGLSDIVFPSKAPFHKFYEFENEFTVHNDLNPINHFGTWQIKRFES